MPRKLPTPCGHRGCPRLSHEHYCNEHKREATRREVAARREKIAIYNTARWRKVRLWGLRREPLCRNCGGAGGTRDHIIPIEMGGDPWDLNNHQTLCFQCHQEKRAREAGMMAKGQTYDDLREVTLICGPPGAGKTTYVKKHMRHGDLILDLDRLFVALSGCEKYDKPDTILPYALAAYDAVVGQLSQETESNKAWVLTSAARRADRARLRDALRAKIVMLETDVDVCLKRIKEDPLRSARAHLWEEIVRKWWTNYEPDMEN